MWTEPVNLQLAPHQTLQLRAAERVRPVLRLLDYMADRPTRSVSQAGRAAASCSTACSSAAAVYKCAAWTKRAVATGPNCCELVLRHCTLIPGWDLGCDCEPKRPNEPSLDFAGSHAALRIEHSILGAIEIAPGEEVRDAAPCTEPHLDQRQHRRRDA